MEEVRPRKRQKATTEDLDNLELMLVGHFGGLGIGAPSTGFGLRDPSVRGVEPEMNVNIAYVVYATAIRKADTYFKALQTELQKALDEGVILIERQEVWLV
jgi:hypothetical protein